MLIRQCTMLLTVKSARIMFMVRWTMLHLVTLKRAWIILIGWCVMLPLVTEIRQLYSNLDYVDTSMYHAGHCKKSLDYVDTSMCHAAFSHCKIDWMMLICRWTTLALVTEKKRLDYVDTSMYHACHLKKELGLCWYVDASCWLLSL